MYLIHPHSTNGLNSLHSRETSSFVVPSLPSFSRKDIHECRLSPRGQSRRLDIVGLSTISFQPQKLSTLGHEFKVSKTGQIYLYTRDNFLFDLFTVVRSVWTFSTIKYTDKVHRQLVQNLHGNTNHTSSIMTNHYEWHSDLTSETRDRKTSRGSPNVK